MAKGGYREEVFNVLLALLLHQRGIVSAPEQSFKQAVESRRHVPDVLVVFQGMTTAIEGKMADQPEARERAFRQVRDRVDKGIAHIGVALLYPPGLKKTPFPELKDAMSRSTFQVAVYSEAGETGWNAGGLDYIADLLKRTFHQMAREDVVARAVQTLDAGITQFAHSVYVSVASLQQAAQILGIGELPKRSRKVTEEDEE